MMLRRQRVLRTLGPALLALGLLSCGGARGPRPNVVLIVIDTLRQDHLPFYGYAENTAPFLGRLADRGMVFDRAYSTSSWTAPATASIVTSLHPIQHGVLRGFRMVEALKRTDPTITLDRIPSDVTTLAERLKESGYATYAVTDNVNVCEGEGFHQGFDRFVNTNYEGADQVNRTLRGWSAEMRENGPYFLYLHYMDPHRPYHRREPWYRPGDTAVLDHASRYDSEIHYVDRRIEEMSDHFGWDRGAFLVVTADHGEEFLDHGDWDHGRTLYSEVLTVPLLLVSPEPGFAPGRHAGPVSLLDVLPTVRDFVGLPPSPEEEGVSLLPILRGRPAGREREFFADLRSPPWLGGRVRKAVIRDGTKYIVTIPGGEELYDLESDPGEHADLAPTRPDDVSRARASLARFEETARRYNRETMERTLTEEEIEKLEALGYER